MVELGDVVELEIIERPSNDELVEWAETGEMVEEIGAARDELVAGLVLNERQPAVIGVSGEGVVWAFEADYAFNVATYRQVTERIGFPLCGGGLSLQILPRCKDGVVLGRRSEQLLVNPGVLSSPSEGIALSDLEGTGARRRLGVARAVDRLVKEELGAIDRKSYSIRPVGLYVAAGWTSLLAVVEFNLRYGELHSIAAEAPDAYEQELVLAGGAAEALARYGRVLGSCTRLLLEAV
jgi:hypothetical protein